MANCIMKHPCGHEIKVLTLFGLLSPLDSVSGELAQTPISKLEALFGDSDAAWLHSLAQGCDTDEVLFSHPYFVAISAVVKMKLLSSFLYANS